MERWMNGWMDGGAAAAQTERLKGAGERERGTERGETRRRKTNRHGIIGPTEAATDTGRRPLRLRKGKIETISSRIDPSTRSILSRIIVDNSNFEIISGQLMTVKIIYDEKNQIGVPESAVTIQGNTAFVYIVNDDTAEKKNIEIGKRNFGKVSVISGLDVGDTVISEGVSKVRNKTKVKIIKPKN